jgi:hypothetical protein
MIQERILIVVLTPIARVQIKKSSFSAAHVSFQAEIESVKAASMIQMPFFVKLMWLLLQRIKGKREEGGISE